jgi:hypothetical protein
LVIGLHLHTLAQVHERLIDLASFRERLTCGLSISGTLGSCQVDDGEVTARPGTLAFCVSLLDLNVEEAVTSRAHSIAASASDLTLHETRLQDHHSFLETSADDLGKTSDYLAVWALLGAFEEKRSAFHIRLLVLRSVSAQQVEDAVIVYFVHGHDDGVFSARVGWYLDIGDRRGLWQR